MNLAAHNQEIGHSDDAALQDDVSARLARLLRRAASRDGVGGMAMFLVGDNGSEEDPQTRPAVPADAARTARTAATPRRTPPAQALADDVARAPAGAAPPRRAGRVDPHATFFVPLENNLFKAAAGVGLFGDRQLYTARAADRPRRARTC